jgi:hypothetical protein
LPKKSSFNQGDYALTFAVSIGRFVDPLAKARNNIKKNISGNDPISLLFNKIDATLSNLQSSLEKGKSGNVVISEMKQSISSNIIENIVSRAMDPKNYPLSTPNKMINVIRKNSSNVGFYDNGNNYYIFGIGNIQNLIDATSIFVSHDPENPGGPYRPPRAYGEVVSYFQLHEYTGASKKTVFASPGSKWWISQPHETHGAIYPHFKGGFKARPIFKTEDDQQFPEDRKIIRNMPRNISRLVIRNIKQKATR